MKTRICPNCFATFIPHATNQKFCPDCRDYRMDEIKKYREKQRREKEARKKRESIDAVCEELEAYNRKHGTLLSYGKYIALRESGRLKK